MGVHSLPDLLSDSMAEFPIIGSALYCKVYGGYIFHWGASAPTTYPTATNGSHRFLNLYGANSAATGTSRGIYTRLYLTGGAGGEAIRAFCTVSSNAPTDTVNGAHLSLNFGSSAGNVTGLGTAARCTLHIPNRSLTGTTAAVQAELYADGASSALGGVTSFLRCVADGNATGVAEIDTSGYFMDVQGLTSASGKLFYANAAASGNHAASLRIRVGSTAYYIHLWSAQA